MSTCFHSLQSILDGDGIHSPISYVYANSTARLAAGGFVQSDGYKLALDSDTGYVFILIDWSAPTWTILGGGGGVTDHGALTGLSDDDHTQYLLADGSRTLSGNLTITGTVDGRDVSADGTALDNHIANTSNPHSTSIANIGSGTLAQLNAAVSDATLDTNTASRPPNGAAGGSLSGTYPNPTLASGSVGSSQITDGSVTFAKLQNISTDTLIGRDSAGSGVPTEISLAATLIWTGSNSIGRAGISGDVTISSGSNTADITAGAIVNADVNASAAIAFSKLATIGTDSLLGRDTAGTGALEAITLNSTLEMNGSQVLGRAAISGDVVIAAGSNTAAIGTGVIVNADINASAAIAVSKLAPGSNTQVLTTSGGVPVWAAPAGGSSSSRYKFDAFSLLSPTNSNWAINGTSAWAADSVNAALIVRRFDDTTEEGIGFGLTIPTGTTNITFYFKSRAQSTPGGTVAVIPSIYVKTFGDNTAPGSWSTRLNMTALSFTTNVNWQYDSQTISLATLGVTAGNYVLFEITRNAASGSDTLSGDWVLLDTVVEFS